MSWTGDMRPGSPYSPGQPGMGDQTSNLFAAHPIGVPVFLLVIGVLLTGAGVHAGGNAMFFAAIGVLVLLVGLIALPLGIVAARRKARTERRFEDLSR